MPTQMPITGTFSPEHEIVERVPHPGLLQQFHGMIEMADAGQDQFRRALQVVGRPGNRYVDIGPVVDVGERRDVTEAVVDDRDHRMIIFCRPTARRAWVPRSISPSCDL